MKFLKTAVCLFVAALLIFSLGGAADPNKQNAQGTNGKKDEYIKWVELNVSEYALNECVKLDKKYHGKRDDFNLCVGLTYLTVKNGNKFGDGDKKNVSALSSFLESGAPIDKLLPQNKFTDYYLNVYGSIFKNYVGKFKTSTGEEGYGLRCYFPLADGYWFNHYDDFGNSRSFGFKRRHLGHDLMGSVGTPVIAVESGTVTECGWNRYGGWRIGIKTADSNRYYYYAHLRKDRPFAANLKLGDSIKAGQVIGYLGRTGYSAKENTNLKTGETHLHFGLQLIYHPSQEKGNKEIWVDCYALTKLLHANRAKTIRDENKEAISQNIKEWIE